MYGNPKKKGRFVLDGVVSLVDAQNIWSHIDGENARWWARSSEVCVCARVCVRERSCNSENMRACVY